MLKSLIYFTAVVSFFFFLQRLISEVTERISTKLGHKNIHLWLRFEKFGPKLSEHLSPTGWGGKPAFRTELWTLTEHILAKEHYINNRKKLVNLHGLPYMPQNLVNFSQETAENGWRVFATPLNFRIGKDCQHYSMDVI